MINIGDKVIITHSTMAHATGKRATVIDRLYSEKENCNLFRVRLDGQKQSESNSYKESDLSAINEAVDQKDSFSVEVAFQDNLAIATLYKSNNGQKEVVEIGHGHVFYNGAVGIAQATSYACKKLLEKINGGSLTLENNNYGGKN